MSMYWELYKKEFRQHHQEYLVLLFFMVFSMITVIFSDPQIFHNTLAKLSWRYPKTSASFEIIWMLTGLLLRLFPPALLVYSLYDEKKTRTDAQELFLPVRRYTLLLNKCLSILCVCLVIDILCAIIWHYFAPKGSFGNLDDVIGIFLSQFSILGITVAAIGITLTVAKNRVLIGLTAFFVLFVIYSNITQQSITYMYTWVQDTFIIPNHVILIYHLINLICSVYIAGMFFLIGLTLYHKRAEV